MINITNTTTDKSIVITCSAPPNKGRGISTYSKLIAEEYTLLNYKVYYLCPSCSDSEWFDKNNIIPLFFEPFDEPSQQTQSIYKLINNISDLIAVINNDVIFVQSLAPVLRVPLLSVVHLDSYTISNAALVNTTYTDFIVAISYDMYKSLIRKSVPSSKCALVYNGIPKQSNVKSVCFKKLNMMTGVEFSDRKGGHSLLRLLKLLKNTELNFTFTWFGRVPAKVSTLFEADERFNFVSQLPRDEYLLKVKESNIYLFPSKEEGCPMSLKEAMSDGLVPIVADGIGAMKNIVQNGIDGYLLNTDDWHKEAFDLIVHLNKNLSSLKDISINAQRKIDNNFTVSNVVKNLELLINRPNVNRNWQGTKEVQHYSWHRLPYPYKKTKIVHYWKLLEYRLGVLKKLNLISYKA